MLETEQFKEDLERLKGFFKMGVLKSPELLKKLESLEGEKAETRQPIPVLADSVLKYEDAAKALGCSVPQIKKLVYAGRLEKAIEPGATRAYGVFASSVRAFMETMRRKRPAKAA